MTKLYKMLAVAYAPENIKESLAKLAELKKLEHEARCEAGRVVADILDVAGCGASGQPNAERLFRGEQEAEKVREFNKTYGREGATA